MHSQVSSFINATWVPKPYSLHYTIMSTTWHVLILSCLNIRAGHYGLQSERGCTVISGSSNCSACSVEHPSPAGFHLYPLKYSSPLISLSTPSKCLSASAPFESKPFFFGRDIPFCLLYSAKPT